jgi:exopolysaccharide biosynthesis WecB/TagA/CpsF family protein
MSEAVRHGTVPRDGRERALYSVGAAAAKRIVEAIETIPDGAAEAALRARIATAERPMVVSFVNQQGLNLAWTNPGFAETLMRSDILLRDGIGMWLCMRMLGRLPQCNMNGTDFIPSLAVTFGDRPMALYGTAEPWSSRAAASLARLGCRIVSVRDGFLDERDYVEDVMRARPALVILAMGMPKQERIAAQLASVADWPLVIVNGGAIADFLAARFPRAPEWMRQTGLEWLFRLGLEPARLWRRYTTGGIAFGWRIIRLWASAKPAPRRRV